VDWCEVHKEETFFSNVTIPTYMAEVCQDTGLYMVHMGSGCVYEGNNLYTEEDIPNFKGSFYSRTKIYSEDILTQYNDILQIRIRMPIDSRLSNKNLITKLTGYRQVINTRNSVTCVQDLMHAAERLMELKRRGIYNVVNPGIITHKQVLEMYRAIVESDFVMPEFIPINKLNTLAARSNCTLSTHKLDNEGIKMRRSEDAIAACMREYKNWKSL
jgi:UDP-glucose 4,6-dehydratase